MGRPNRPGRAIHPTSITMHNTSNTSPGADAKAHSRFVRNTGHYVLRSGRKNWVSWHYTVDDNVAIQHLPNTEMGWHAGPANGSSIGIEVCMHQGINRDLADRRAAALVAKLLRDLGLTRNDIKTHKDWTGKTVPRCCCRSGRHSSRWSTSAERAAASADGCGAGRIATGCREGSAACEEGPRRDRPSPDGDPRRAFVVGGSFRRGQAR